MKSGPVVLTTRDLDVLALVGLCRYVTTEQVARECFPNLDRCQRRLRQLLDGGFVRVALVASTSPNLVSLTPAGLALLAERRPETADRASLAYPINLVSVEHHTLRVDVRLYLAVLARSERGRLLRFEGGQGGLAEELGLGHAGLMPDGLAVLDLGSGPMRLAIEADCGTEVNKTLAAKLGRYREVVNTEALAEVWVVVNGGTGRRSGVEELARQVGVAEWTRVMTRERVNTRPVLRPGPRAAGRHRAEGPNAVPDACSVSLTEQGVAA